MSSRTLHHLLGDGLVHGHTAGEVSAPGVGDAQQVKCRLDPAVLPALPVEAEKDRVRRPADLQRPGAEEAGRLVPPPPAHGLKVRRVGGDGRLPDEAGAVEHILRRALVPLQAQVHIHHHRPVPPLPQGRADVLPRHQRHMALRGQSPGQYDDLQSHAPPLPVLLTHTEYSIAWGHGKYNHGFSTEHNFRQAVPHLYRPINNTGTETRSSLPFFSKTAKNPQRRAKDCAICQLHKYP